MRANKLLLLLVLVSFKTVFAQNSTTGERPSTREYANLELPKIQVIPISDSNTKRRYEIYIKLPEGYLENKAVNYPVIYFTDAMWHIEILSGSSEYLMDNLILVGISWQKDEKPEISRFRDYTLLKSMNPTYLSGDAENHLSFIQNEVIKYVEDNYRTAPDNRTYFGYSLGATFGAYILLTQPNTFKNYILGSPETLLDDTFIHTHKSTTAQNIKYLSTNVFISTGELERTDLKEQAKSLSSMLKSDSHENISLDMITIKAADHKKAFPMTALKSMYWLSELLTENKNRD